MDNMITLTIDGVQVSVPAGTTVLEAARKAKEEEAAERRQRNDELREEAAERARVNNSVLGRMKNTAISSATRTVTNKLTNEILKGLGLGKKK